MNGTRSPHPGSCDGRVWLALPERIGEPSLPWTGKEHRARFNPRAHLL